MGCFVHKSKKISFIKYYQVASTFIALISHYRSTFYTHLVDNISLLISYHYARIDNHCRVRSNHHY
jgi:hypothetical protein